MPQTGKRVARTRISQNRTTTVPEPIRTAEGIGEGDEVDWFTDGDDWILEASASDGKGGCTDCEHTREEN